uniref:DNA-directed RNA polymerase n=1 Tax=Opuntia streptacantha TaxID=393608 RepID=A0A7C9DQI9_OPUST
MAPLLFEDIFNITRIDPDSKKFDKVSHIEAHSDKFDAYMLLDVNIDVYPINQDKRYTIALASTLDLDGTPDSGCYNPMTQETLADRYEFFCFSLFFWIQMSHKDQYSRIGSLY